MSAKTGRQIHLILMAVWVFIGLPVSWFLRHSLEWIIFMSWYAIIVSHWAGLSAERPSEIEGDDVA